MATRWNEEFACADLTRARHDGVLWEGDNLRLLLKG